MTDRAHARTASPMTVLAVVGFGVFVAADDLTVVSTMLRPIIGDLGIVLPDGLDDAAWIVNAYLIAYVAVMPFVGRLSDIVGRRKVFMAAMTLFLLGSIVIPFTESLGPFLVGRVMTAIGGGALVPVGMAVVGDVFEEGRRARALGILGAVDTLGWVWGPLYGAMLVRFASWEWQFYLNWPLAVLGMVVGWKVLADFDRPMRKSRIDWAGATALTTTLVALNLALLGSAEIQSVTGLEELTGSGGAGLRWFYLVAITSGAWFLWLQSRTEDPIIDFGLFSGRNLAAAVVVNFLVGAALVIAMVDVPLFVNVIELDIERSAVIAGWLLAALTATMSVASYVGGRMTERTWYRPPVLIGLGAIAIGFVLMGLGWGADTSAVGAIDPVPSYGAMAWQLALLGLGFGLVIAPTSAAVVDGAPADRRGTAASLVVVFRLMGLSVGLSGLTAWGLYRFNQLRTQIELPPISDPGFQEAITDANAELTTGSLAGTFAAAAVVTFVAIGVTLMMHRDRRHSTPGTGTPQPTVGSKSQRPSAATDQGPPGVTAMKEHPMKDFLSRNLAAAFAVLAALILASLALNVVMVNRVTSVEEELATTRADLERVEAGAALFAAQVQGFQQQLSDLAPAVADGLDEAVDGLVAFRTSTIEFDVAIDETVAIDTVIDLNRTIQVPINTSIPINETFDTRIVIDGPFGIDIPLNITVPIAVEVPVDLTVAIPVNETFPIRAEVPVRVAVPIAIDVAGTQLADLAQSLEAGLLSFKQVLAGLNG